MMEAVSEKINIKKYCEYKNSGAEWLGDIPEHWEVSRLGKILTPTSIKNHAHLPLLSITREKGVILRDLDEEENHNFIPDDLSNYKVLNQGQFGMNKMKAWQGSYGISPFTGIVSPAYFTFTLDSKIVPEFFHLAIRSKVYVSFFASASDGVRVGQWDLSKERMKQIPFLIPSVEEQSAIANFLDRKTAQIDKAIAQKEKLIALLKERRQILIHKVVTRGLDENVRMKKIGVEFLEEIPNHWNMVKFKFIIRTKARLGWKGLKASEYIDKSDFGFLSTPNIKEDEIDFNNAYFITERRYEESPEIMLQVGDVLLAKDGSTLGTTNIVSYLPFKCTVNSSIAVLRVLESGKLSASYLHYFLKSEYSKSIIEMKKDGMGVPHLFQSDINNFIVLLPPIEEQREIVDWLNLEIAKVRSVIQSLEIEIENLKEYKITLINAAVTGKIKVC